MEEGMKEFNDDIKGSGGFLANIDARVSKDDIRIEIVPMGMRLD